MTHVANLCGKTLSVLPPVSTINKLGDQRLSFSYKHISEDLTQKVDTTLQSGETRTHGDIYEVYSVMDEEQDFRTCQTKALQPALRHLSILLLT